MPGFMAGNVTAYLKLNTSGWTSGIQGAKTSLQSLARTSAMVGAASTANIVLITREYGKFDKAIRHATSVSELSQKQFEQMSKMALDASVQWNKAASDTAQAFYFLGSAGLTATEQMDAFNQTIMLSRAMGSNLAMTVEGLVDIVKAFGLEFENTTRIADVLTKTVISSNQHFSDLDKALSYAGATAAFTNNTLEETTAMLGIMANAGIKGSMAGTVLRRALANLVAPTAAMSDLIYELGINTYDTTGKMKPFIDIMGQISDAIAGTSEEYRNMVFKVLFGVRAIGGQIALFNYGSQAIRKYADEIKNAGGVTERVAGKQMKAMMEQLGRLYRQAQKLAIMLGEQLAPAIKRVADRLMENAKGMEDFIKNNAEAIRTALKWIGLISAAAVAIPVVAGIAGALLSLINPFTVVLFALYSLRTLWVDSFGGDGELVKSLKAFGGALTDFVDGAYTKAMENISNKVQEIKKDHEVLAALLDLGQLGVVTAVGAGKAIDWGIKQQADNYAKIWVSGYRAWDKARTGFYKRMRKTQSVLNQSQRDALFGADNEWIGTYGVSGRPSLGQSASDVGQSASDVGQSALNAGRTLLKKNFEQLTADFDNYMKPLWEKMEESLPKGMQGAIDTIKNLFNLIMQEPIFAAQFGTWIDDFNTKIKESQTKWAEAHKPIVAQTKELGSKMGNAWNNALREMFDPTEGFIVTWKDMFFDVLSSIRSGWADTISSFLANTYNGARTFENFMTDVFNAVRRSFAKLVADLTANQLLFALFGERVTGLQMGTAKWGDIFGWLTGKDRTGFMGGVTAPTEPFTGYNPIVGFNEVIGEDFTGGLQKKVAGDFPDGEGTVLGKVAIDIHRLAKAAIDILDGITDASKIPALNLEPVKSPVLKMPSLNPEQITSPVLKIPSFDPEPAKSSGLSMSNQKPAISFNLNNQTTVPVTAKPAGMTFNGKQWVVDVVLEEMRTNRGFAEQMGRR